MWYGRDSRGFSCVVSVTDVVPMPNPGRFQFSILRLVVLIAACAVVLGWTNRLPGHFLFRLVVGGYLTLIAAWLILRLPYIVQRLLQVNTQRRRILQQRKDLLKTVSSRSTTDDGQR